MTIISPVACGSAPIRKAPSSRVTSHQTPIPGSAAGARPRSRPRSATVEAKGGRLLNFWGMPWPWLHNLSSDDAIAIARYLKTLPPVHNDIPLPLHYGVIESIAAKLWNRDPLLGRTPVLTYAVGSYANLPPPSIASIASGLATAQWIVLVVGLILFAIVSRRSLPRGAGGWMRMIAIAAVGVIIFAVGYFIDATPTIRVLPPDQIADGATGNIPRPDVSNLSLRRAPHSCSEDDTSSPMRPALIATATTARAGLSSAVLSARCSRRTSRPTATPDWAPGPMPRSPGRYVAA